MGVHKTHSRKNRDSSIRRRFLVVRAAVLHIVVDGSVAFAVAATKPVTSRPVAETAATVEEDDTTWLGTGDVFARLTCGGVSWV